MSTEATTIWQDDDAPLGPAPVKKRKKKTDDEMDITPMIDMTFLLLIYFLVASTPDKNTVVDLATAMKGESVAQLNAVVFTIGEGGLESAPVYNADGKIPGAELSNDLDQRAKQIKEIVEKGFRAGNADVVIKADKGVKFRETDRVMKAASRVQGIQIHLAVKETKER